MLEPSEQCPLGVDAVEKGFLGGSPSNIDSRRASNAQDRFKNSAPMIRLLRAGGMPGTFSTVSVKRRRTHFEQMFPAYPRKQTLGISDRHPDADRVVHALATCVLRPLAENSLQVQSSGPSSNRRLSVIEPCHAGIRNSAASDRSVWARHSPTEAGVEHKLRDTANGSDLWRADQPSRCPGVRPQQRREPVKPFKILTAVAVLAAVSIAPASAADISGAGATFPYPIYAKWADAYEKATGNGLNYQSIGSGGGIKQIKARTVTFGASDMPLKADELAKDALVQFPTVMGGVVPVINLEGVAAGALVLDGPTLAQIFLGEVQTWDDPAIKKLNPQAKLPSDAIVIVHRSDGSGTTFIFTDYLSKVSPDWKSKVGSNTAVEWSAGTHANGNEGVANNVAQTRGSIGYVEYAYASQHKLAFTQMVNRDGKPVTPDAAGFQAAAANADWE